jgi:hypothetical protein
LSCRCLESKIQFNTEALEKLVYDPEWVLENEESFWTQYPSQRYTRNWIDQVNYKMDYEKWRKTVRDWSEVPEEKRLGMDFLRNAERIIEGRQIFIEKALPHVCSYLPKEANLDISVHFTAYVPPRAFAMGEIVINMTATYWNNNPNNILNTMVHELFHVGYSYCENLRGGEEEGSLNGILRNIHNEGVCTYIGYMAQDIFPAPDEKDYVMLDNEGEVRRHLENANMILSKVGNIPEEELDKLSWEEGVMARSYYVTGAHMCRVIEGKSGTDVLKQTLVDGPGTFFESYNDLVPEKERLIY